jgi:hypothetical protein
MKKEIDIVEKYCKNCVNRKYNKWTGIICGLTNKIPDFSLSCSDYKADVEFVINEKERKPYILDNCSSEEIDGYTKSSSAKMKFDFLKIFPNSREIILKKSRYDRLSIYFLLGFIPSFLILVFRNSEVQENLHDPINLILPILALVYPLIRYYLPFPQFRLNKDGISLNMKSSIKWTEIESIRRYDLMDDEDNAIIKTLFFFRLKTQTTLKINITNYKWNVGIKLDDTIKTELTNIRQEEIIESIIVSFYNEFSKRTNHNNVYSK